MSLIFAFFVFSQITYVLAKSRSCINSDFTSFTGYRIENHLNLKTFQSNYHMVYCNDNKYIYGIDLNESIPWTKEIRFGDEILTLARRKSFALREIPVYLPDNIIGGIYIVSSKGDSISPVVPLISDNLLYSWIEIDHRLEMIYHVPILSTPRLDSPKFEIEKDWDKYILMNEKYDFKYDPRFLLRRNLDFLIKVVDSVLQKKTKRSLFVNVILISQEVSSMSFKKLIKGIDSLLKYEQFLY